MGRPKTDIGEWGTIKVTKEDEGRWVARGRVRNLRGKLQQVSRSGGTREDARGRLKEAMRAEARKVEDAEITRDTPFHILAESYIGNIRRSTLAETTCDRYEHTLRHIVIPELGDLPLRKLTVRRLQVLFDSLSDAGRAPGGMSTTSSPLSGALKLAVLDNALPSNPMLGVSMPRKEMAYSTAALSADEVDRLLELAAAHSGLGELELYDVAVLLVSTGARISEVLGLAWSDVLMPDKDGQYVLRMFFNAVRVKGKGMTRQRGKTKASRREVLMSPMVLDVMRRRATYEWVDLDMPVFPAWPSGNYRNPDSVRDALKTIYPKIPSLVKVDQPTHIFRKTAATLMIDAGLSARKVADQLGHSSVSMVLDVYAARSQRSKEAMEALDFTRRRPPALDAAAAPSAPSDAR